MPFLILKNNGENAMTTDDKALPPTPPPSVITEKRNLRGKYYAANIAEKIIYAQRATESLNQNPEVRQIMARVGYTDSKIEEFTRVYDAAATAHVKQQKEAGDKTGAYARFEQQFSLAKEEFNLLRKTAKVAFKNSPTYYDRLKLSGKRGVSTGSIFIEIDNFYLVALGDQEILDILASFGYSIRRMKDCHNSYLDTRSAYNDYIKENTQSVEATKERDEKMEILDGWMYDYYSLAKVAYAQRPDLMPAENQ